MYINKIAIVYCVITFTHGYYRSAERGIWSGVVWNDKPVVVEDSAHNKWISPSESSDGCDREHPLSPNNNRTLELAYHRYNIVPGVYPFPPAQYLEVFLNRNGPQL